MAGVISHMNEKGPESERRLSEPSIVLHSWLPCGSHGKTKAKPNGYNLMGQMKDHMAAYE